MKSSCCRRALLYGALLGAEVRENAVFFSTEYEEISIYMTKLIREFFKQEPALDYKIYVGRPRYTLWFESTKLISYLRAVEKSEEGLLELLGKSCVSCAQALLRGVFLAFGTVSDPTNSYHAEFLVPSAARAEKLDAFLAELGLSARKISRGNKIGLYYKSSSAIEELFAEMGGSRAVFDLVNAKIEREIRNNENRATNCDARNIARTVDASQKQIAAIVKLTDCGMLDGLEEDLKKTAELRMEYDGFSLSELAAKHEPPISKSGLNHRLAKLCELAEKIK
ncbi:MAG: DNA-binding protein WhiA [Clostridia bacterium]|nr:DNA-binding protein WhiA [Clostridia bacterium]